MENENEIETTEVKTGIRFTNDFDDELKAKIKEAAAKRIDELLEADEFSINDIAQLAGVSHGSVKGRAKTLASAAEIVNAILSGTRAGGTKKAPSMDSIKSFVESLDPEAKSKFLAELGITAV
jgi:4-diphosphocytidyl-2C-methyl-D-erythritol kinase